MRIDNQDIANNLAKLADLLELRGANPFRIRAYRNAARTIMNLKNNLSDMIKNGEDITKIRGIGKAIGRKIQIIVKTGKLPFSQYTTEHFPHTVSELTRIEGLGPKRIRILNEEHHIYTIEDLKKALLNDDIAKFSRIGLKLIKKIREELQHYHETQKIFRFSFANLFAKSLYTYISRIPDVLQVEIAGSLRRQKDQVANINFLVSSQDRAYVVNEFLLYEDIIEICSSTPQSALVRLKSGIVVDLQVVFPKNFYAALVYYTGAKAHVDKLQSIAEKKGYHFTEDGFYKQNDQIKILNEKNIYQHLGLPYISPELRENSGEIEAAIQKKLPKLIALDDIRGDLHCHTNETDGVNSLEEMIRAAINHGYDYIGITDHTKRLAMVRGLDEKRLFAQIKEIEHLQHKYPHIKILKGSEVDILDDGRLDLSDAVLKELDFTVCSIHYKFRLNPQQQTERILRAMDSPYFTILGHPTGRLIHRREPYGIDLEKIMQKAKERKCFLELNAQPERLDLNSDYCRMAKEFGVKLAISTDAHSIFQLNFMPYGISQARRGWIEKKDVINTYPFNQLQLFFQHKK